MRKWIAHRGNNNHGYSENTKKALLTTLATDYIAGVELDVRKTKDNQLVIIHNPTISWTSDGTGIVKYMTLTELEQYHFGKELQKICTLDAFLKEVQNTKIIMIEVKDSSISELLFETIQNYPKLNLYISSFDDVFLRQFKKQHPEYKVGLIMGEMINHNKDTSLFDFIVTKDIHFQKNKEIFLWGIGKKDLNKINSDAYIITDNAYLWKDVYHGHNNSE